ncbi:MAG: phenylalanine--tRNA ligase subunit beta, partial [Myxococcales bacterium]|nr:phenylalanine--tRNA ligase subunit beta [Myxococcales bacterium]
LNELVEFDREISAEEGAAALTGAGLEVEEFRSVGSDFTGVVIAEVVSKEKHPNADKLTIVNVIDKEGDEPTVVICGAPNVPEPGGRVLWAKPGAELPGGFKLGEKKLKGVLSAGMLCAEDELGLGEGHDGIVVLGPEAKELSLGAPAAEALGLADVVFDLCIPANRADALGHVGIARELAALLGGRAILPDADLSAVLDSSRQCADLIGIEIKDSDACPRYLARVIDGVKVGPSPIWMQQRLRNVGVRPISNLVDVTNYVMFELGQPLHAFDYEKVQGKKIVVRRAAEGEKMTTLDDVERGLLSSDLLVCDSEAPVAIAGVMGGQTSEVSDSTTLVLLESASFEAMTVRRAAKRLGLHSDASHRFERAVDPNGTDLASRRAALLLAQLGGGKVVDGTVDAYPTEVMPIVVSMRRSRCAALSGIDVARDVMTETLERQGLSVKAGEGDLIEVEVPTARADITREVDLIEEVVRIYGFDRVPATLPATTVRPKRRADLRRVRAQSAMIRGGYCESLSYGFTSPQKIAALGYGAEAPESNPIKIDNPMTIEQSVMRTSLWPNLLGSVAHNRKREVHEVRLFEMGNVFLHTPDGGVHEPLLLCSALAGRRDGWLRPGADVDFFDAKGAAVGLLEGIYGSAEGFTFRPNPSSPLMHPGISAGIFDASDKEIGCVGEIHPTVREAFDVELPVFGLELRIDDLAVPSDAQMSSIPRYPAVSRDISMLVDEPVPVSQMRDIIEGCEEALVAQVQVLEDYRDPAHVPEGKKGMLWSVTYRSVDRTLTDAEVDKAHGRIEEKLLGDLQATRR